MAHKKGLGSTRNGRDSNPQMLGVKHFGGEHVGPGMVIVRQHGTRSIRVSMLVWAAIIRSTP